MTIEALTELEKSVIEDIRASGQYIDLKTLPKKPNHKNTIRAEVIRRLVLVLPILAKENKSTRFFLPSITIKGVWIKGSLDLENCMAGREAAAPLLYWKIAYLMEMTQKKNLILI